MPRGQPKVVKDNLDKVRQSAIAAVEAYNRPAPRFRTALFIILIVIAWTALFHAVFYKKGRKPWYQKRGKTGKGIRYVKVDGDAKHWDLAECLKEFYGANTPPERKNLEFLIGLRNRIEHRHLPQLDATLYGECQASLINLEALLVAEFGSRHALTDQLGVALQFSQLIPDEKAKAVKSATKAAAAPVTAYIESFRRGLPSTVLESMKYSFSVYLVPRVASREKAADAAVTFVKVDEASPEELDRIQKLNVLIRDKHIPIANLGLHKPGDVVGRLNLRLSYEFTVHLHTRAWQVFGVRPPTGATKPAKTDTRYCIYDEPHGDYLYTEAWIERLAKEFEDPARLESLSAHTSKTP